MRFQTTNMIVVVGTVISGLVYEILYNLMGYIEAESTMFYIVGIAYLIGVGTLAISTPFPTDITKKCALGIISQAVITAAIIKWIKIDIFQIPMIRYIDASISLLLIGIISLDITRAIWLKRHSKHQEVV